ncbi:MAG: AMP-binding protein [Paludibacteraceae bacterium]|nr:AMP-binding protein [Paludibacteraceae bacterium]
MENCFIEHFERSIKENWDLTAMTNYITKQNYTYKQVGEEIARLHILFKELNISQQDKIALVGRNTPEWAITFLATITYGAVIVPILQDFHPNDIQHIVNHSESKLLFLSDSQWENLTEENLQTIRGVFSITDFRCIYQAPGESIQMTMKHLNTIFEEKYHKGFTKDDVTYPEKDAREMAVLNYTSGTTGFSKGVMLSGINFCSMIDYSVQTSLVGKGYKILSFLPLAHAYGCAFDFIAQFAGGSHITFLTRLPSPKVLLKAMEDVKPDTIFTVPLIIEKIYKNNILPMISKTSIKVATNIPIISNRIYAEIRNKLINVFGGEFKKLVIGGAPFNREVEDFLLKINFPFTVGYGMTECAPLISVDCESFTPHSVGKPITDCEVKIDSADPYNTPGEILVKGKNVMLGYYKNEEATKNVFTEDGWLRTGDIGVIDKENNIYIKGRSKTMILTSSGQNVYPEEIEAKINNLPFVSESIVIQSDDKIVALVYPDFAAMDEMRIDHNDLEAILEEQRKGINQNLAAYEQIKQFKIHPTEFEKTPKKSIKRYLYEK